MKKGTVVLLCLLLYITSSAQRLLSWSPEFITDTSSTVTIICDASLGNKGLLNYTPTSDVYVHIGLITSNSTGPSNWLYVPSFSQWGTTNSQIHCTSLGNNKWQYTITGGIRNFFGVTNANEQILKIALLFRNGSGAIKQSNSDGSDMFVPVYQSGAFAVRINLPASEPRSTAYNTPPNIIVGGNINIAGVSSANASLSLSLDGANIASATAANAITNTQQINTACQHKIILTGNNGTSIQKDSFSFYINPITNVASLPAGTQEGINYGADSASATLVLYAPNKNHATVIGDFSNWQSLCSNQMNKTPDGNYYWLTVSGLTKGIEYGYQYIVDDTIKIADPYSQKILDPSDVGISAITYPNLKPYPTGQTGLVSIMQISEPQYIWQVQNFTRPDKRNLMTYELLVRDFTAQHSYQALIDSFQYFKNIGINAIELMPINEFTGNDSWGYNPEFYFAPDKYYGTKNKLKEFIDKCHQNGIAVILDMVFNQCDNNAPEALLYWDAINNRPAANNPWLNPSAPHPYSVFNDFNHTSTATQYLVNRALKFWINEYKVDGYRFDLAKGFTQTVTNTTTVENYDGTRVANLERYYDSTNNSLPGRYMILEFLSSNFPSSEEQEYANHGFMLWGNNNAQYNQCTMGYTSNSDLSRIVWNDPSKAFSNPAEMGYMESHDEERTMYKNLTYGNSSGSYNVKNLPTALAREEAAASVFFTVPGPKMIWQFEERGYDTTINYGGSNVTAKPPFWNYMTDPNRLHLYNTYNKLISLRLSNPSVFNNPSFTYDFNNSGGLVKTFQIVDTASTGKKVTILANLDVVAQTKSVTFQSTGEWTNYVSNGPTSGINGTTGTNFTLTTAAQSITLQPGEYHVYVSLPVCTTPMPTATTTINYCQNATATALTATGTNLLWYTLATGGTGTATAPIPSTTTIGTVTYYVSQTISCESARLPIVVNVVATTPAPTVTSPISYCQNSTATALTATGTSLKWYTVATGGTGSATAPTPSTSVVGSISYYVSQTLSCGEGARAVIVVNVNAIPSAPSVTTPVIYCQNSTAVALTATGANLLWYNVATSGTGSATAPTPSTTTSGTTNYYVSQTVNSCESPRALLAVVINAAPSAPIVNGNVSYCQNATASTLTSTGTNLLWYTVATGGTGTATAPTPSTTTSGITNYYVSQTVSGCESPRASITVTINALPSIPVVVSPITYCQNVTASALTATGTNLLWYAAVSGSTGSSTAPIPSTLNAGLINYYVTQSNACGESARTPINVVTTATPSIVTGLNATAIAMTTATLNWTTIANLFYTIDYKLSSSSVWINVANNITSGSVTLNNLTASSTYNWRVSVNCTATSTNNYATAQFSTISHNSVIDNIKDGLGIKISPNPIAQNSIVDYIVPANGTVTITIYDAYGQRVQSLYQGNQNAGQYQLILTNQLNILEAATYFIRLQQNGKGSTSQFFKL